MDNTDKEKCSGLLNFCNDLNGFMTATSKSKGIGAHEFINVKLKKTVRRIAYLRYGKKYDEVIALKYCPFCGADFEKMGRLE